MLVPNPSASTLQTAGLLYRRRRRPLGDLRAAGRALLALERAGAPAPVHRVAAAMHGIAAALLECEADGQPRETVLTHVSGLRDLLSRSPLVHRLQTWPRGYPGDFETVEWLCDAANQAPPGSVMWAVEHFALQSPVAQQHRNKVALQADAMREAIAAIPDATVLSIGCGGCRDLRTLAPTLGGTRAQFTLVDADPGALAFAEARLGALSGQCTFVHGRVPRVLPRLRDRGPYNLIVAGGLFDYLPDRWAVETLRQIKALLLPEGALVFSNIAKRNPYGPLIEYLAEWVLIERSDPELLELLSLAGFNEARATIVRDVTGLASMVRVAS